jgi:DNA-binding NarL/FixJ family response regulator
MLRILICDERPLISNALQQMLADESDLELVGIADSGVHAIMLIRSWRPDVVVSGLRLRGMSGTDLARQIRAGVAGSQPPIVLYAVRDSDADLAEVLEAGVDGLLADDAGRDELVLAIKAVARGEAMLGPSVARRLVGWFRDAPQPATDKHESFVATLTAREREVLTLVAQGMSTEEIARHLFIGVATVRTHLYRLKSKLDLRDRAALVSFAYRAGLMEPR